MRCFGRFPSDASLHILGIIPAYLGTSVSRHMPHHTHIIPNYYLHYLVRKYLSRKVSRYISRKNDLESCKTDEKIPRTVIIK